MPRPILHRILVALGYAALTAVLVGVTVGLVAYGQGYAYDFKSKRIIQTGIVMIQSTPSGVAVQVDGKAIKKKTPFRASFEGGQTHNFELSKPGYHTWSKSLLSIASQVTLAQYVLMVPRELPRVTVGSYKVIKTQALSSDHRHMAYVVEDETRSGIYTILLDNAKPARIYTPQIPIPGQPLETITEVAWSHDASHLLVTAQSGPAITYYVMNADGTDVTNLTARFGALGGIKFSGNNWRQLYWISPEGLRRLDLSSQSISEILADKVTQFSITSSDRVIYVQVSPTGHSLWSIDGRGQKQEIVQALAVSDSYIIESSSYDRTDMLAVIPTSTRVGTLYTDIYSTNLVATTVARDVTSVSFSPGGHFAAFVGPKTVTAYDLERSTFMGRTVLYSFASLASEVPVFSWFDDFHIMTARPSGLDIREFDGSNAVTLSDNGGRFPAASTDDLRKVFFFRQTATGDSIEAITLKK